MRQMSQLLGALVAVACACAAVYLLKHDLAQLRSASLARLWNVGLAAGSLSIGNYALRIVRWRSYLAALGQRFPLRFMALTYTAGFAYTLSPGKLGEMVRARYYERVGVPFSKVAAAFFAERLLDLVAMMVLAALLLGPSGVDPRLMRSAVALLVLALAALAIAPWNALASRLAASAGAPSRPRKLLAHGFASLAAARTLFSPPLIVLGFALGLAAWGLEGIGLGVIASAFPAVHLSSATALGIYGVAVLVGGVSFLPGGLGSAEVVMAALLVARGFPSGEALVITLVCRLATLWLAVLLGWAAVLALRQRPAALVSPWP